MPESPFDNPKVMDVNRPGRGRVMPTSSRPVVAPVVSNEANDGSINVEPPSSSHKVISPINDIDKNEQIEEPEQTSEDTGQLDTVDEPESAVATDNIPKEDLGQEEDGKENQDYKEEPPEALRENSNEVTDEKAESELETPAPEKTETTRQSEVSDAAGVNALAASANSKREAHKKAEEELKKDEEVGNLIASKEYNVSIGNNSSKGTGMKVVYVLVGLVVLAGISLSIYMFISSGSI